MVFGIKAAEEFNRFFDDREGARAVPSAWSFKRVHPAPADLWPPAPTLMTHHIKSTEQFMAIVRTADLGDLKSQREIFST